MAHKYQTKESGSGWKDEKNGSGAVAGKMLQIQKNCIGC